MFLSAFQSEGLNYAGGGCQVAHEDVTWSISLIVDGTGTQAPYRLMLGASLARLENGAPRNAEECGMFLPLAYEGSAPAGSAGLHMPDAVFPDWSGSDDDRARAVAECVTSVSRYARQVDSLHELRVRHTAGDYAGAFIIAPLRRLLEDAS
jgi:hypothetical protein